MTKPVIADPPAAAAAAPVVPPVVPAAAAPAAAAPPPIATPNPDLSELKNLIVEMQQKGSTGMMAMFQKAQEINGKMDRLVLFIEANPAASFKDAIDELRKDTSTIPGTPEIPASADSLADKIAAWWMPGIEQIGK